MTNDEIVQLNREYTFFSWSVQGTVDPVPITRAEGVYLWDAEGNRYLDFSAQLMNVNIGHSHPKVVQAIKEQADRLLYAAPATAPTTARLTERSARAATRAGWPSNRASPASSASSTLTATVAFSASSRRPATKSASPTSNR